MSMSGWWIFLAIAGFSIGEMTASPTKMRYLASIAPPGKDGQYMGYANMTVGIGWSIGSIIAGELYEHGGDKINLARRYLTDHAGVSSHQVEELTRDRVLPFFEQTVGVDAWGARELLWQTYEPYSMWAIFTVVGVGSLLLLILYNAVVLAAEKNPDHAFNNARGIRWVQIALVPLLAVFLYASFAQGSLAIYVWTVLFALMLATSFWVANTRDSGEADEAAKDDEAGEPVEAGEPAETDEANESDEAPEPGDVEDADPAGSSTDD
jgi:MFS family permease